MIAPFQIAVRFILELAAAFAAGSIGASIGSPPLGLVGAIAFAVPFVVVWGLFLAPRARFPQPAIARFVVGTILMESVAVGYAVVGRAPSGVILAVVILANAVALAALGATDPDRAFEQ
jgi:cytochrome b